MRCPVLKPLAPINQFTYGVRWKWDQVRDILRLMVGLRKVNMEVHTQFFAGRRWRHKHRGMDYVDYASMTMRRDMDGLWPSGTLDEWDDFECKKDVCIVGGECYGVMVLRRK